MAHMCRLRTVRLLLFVSLSFAFVTAVPAATQTTGTTQSTTATQPRAPRSGRCPPYTPRGSKSRGRRHRPLRRPRLVIGEDVDRAGRRQGQFFALTEPRVVLLNVFTAVIGMFLATPAMVALPTLVPMPAGEAMNMPMHH